MPATYNTLLVSRASACSARAPDDRRLRRAAAAGTDRRRTGARLTAGVCLAFIVLRRPQLAAMLLGALATGVLGVVVITLLLRGRA